MSLADTLVLELGQSVIRYGYNHTPEPYGCFQSDSISELLLGSGDDFQQRILVFWKQVLIQSFTVSLTEKKVVLLYPYSTSTKFVNSTIDVLYTLLQVGDIHLIPQYSLPLLVTGKASGFVVEWNPKGIQIIPTAFGVTDLFHSVYIPSTGDTFLHNSEGLSTLTYSLLTLLLQLPVDVLIPCASTILLCGECNWSQEIIQSLQETIQIMSTSNSKFSRLHEVIKHIQFVNGGRLAIWKGYCVHTIANLKDTQISKVDWMKGKRWSWDCLFIENDCFGKRT